MWQHRISPWQGGEVQSQWIRDSVGAHLNRTMMSEAVGHRAACGWMPYIVLKSVRWVPSLQGTNNNKYLEWMEYILIFDTISFGMQEFYITQFNFTEKHKKIERFDCINFTAPFLGTRNWREGRACTATEIWLHKLHCTLSRYQKLARGESVHRHHC
jgi:hypothetical protein